MSLRPTQFDDDAKKHHPRDDTRQQHQTHQPSMELMKQQHDEYFHRKARDRSSIGNSSLLIVSLDNNACSSSSDNIYSTQSPTSHVQVKNEPAQRHERGTITASPPPVSISESRHVTVDHALDSGKPVPSNSPLCPAHRSVLVEARNSGISGRKVHAPQRDRLANQLGISSATVKNWMNNQRRNDKRNRKECHEAGDTYVTTTSEQHHAYKWQSSSSSVDHQHQENTLNINDSPLTYNHDLQTHSLRPQWQPPPSSSTPSLDVSIPFGMDCDHSVAPSPHDVSTPWQPQKLHRPAAATTIVSPFAAEPVFSRSDNAEWMLPYDISAASSSPPSGLHLDLSPMSAYSNTFPSSFSPTAIVNSAVCTPYSMCSGPSSSSSSDAIPSNGNVLQTPNVGDMQLPTPPYTLSQSQCQPQYQLHDQSSNCHNVGNGTVISTSIICDNMHGAMETGTGATSHRVTVDNVHVQSNQQNQQNHKNSNNINSTHGIAIPFSFSPTSSPYSAPPLPAANVLIPQRHAPRVSVMNGLLDTVNRELYAQSGRLALEYTQLANNIATMSEPGAKTACVAAAVASAASQHAARHQQRSPLDTEATSTSTPSTSAVAATATAAAAADYDLRMNNLMHDVVGVMHDLRDIDRLSRHVSNFPRSHNQTPQPPQPPQQSEQPQQPLLQTASPTDKIIRSISTASCQLGTNNNSGTNAGDVSALPP